MISRRRVAGLAVGIAYLALYTFFAILPAGAGHGTYVFFLPLWPNMIGGLSYPAIGFIGVDLSSTAAKLIFVSLIGIHYLLIILAFYLTDLTDPEYFYKVWKHSPMVIVVPTTLFIAAEVVIWTRFVAAVFLSTMKSEVDE
jgi:hypothetical protein